jgi:large subunit ribosomal protein L39e
MPVCPLACRCDHCELHPRCDPIYGKLNHTTCITPSLRTQSDQSPLTTCPQSHKSFRTKQKLARAQKQNRPIPQWIRLRTGNTIRFEIHQTLLPIYTIQALVLSGPNAWTDVYSLLVSSTDTTPSEDTGGRRGLEFEWNAQLLCGDG